MSLSLENWKAQATRTLDVRPDLERGDEPFVRIMEAAVTLPENGILAVIAPFEPVPLYSVLSLRGFHHETRKVTEDEWIVQFRHG